MAIFNSYVKLPEGNTKTHSPTKHWDLTSSKIGALTIKNAEFIMQHVGLAMKNSHLPVDHLRTTIDADPCLSCCGIRSLKYHMSNCKLYTLDGSI